MAGRAGETLTAGGTITGIDSGSGEITIEVFVRNEAGDVVAPGTAVAVPGEL